MDPWNKLDDAVVESVLARLSSLADIASSALVCKRWNSIIFRSSTFAFTLNQFANRRLPWIYMVTSSSTSVVYDVENSKWRHICQGRPSLSKVCTPVADSGGLICFKSKISDCYPLVIYNPLTRSSRYLPEFSNGDVEIKGIVMHSSKQSNGSLLEYKVFVVFKSAPNALNLKVFSSSDQDWREMLLELDKNKDHAGSLNRDWLHTNKLTGFTTIGNEGQIIVNYFDETRKRFCCIDTLHMTFFTSQYLMNGYCDDVLELEVNVVKCRERVLVVGLELEWSDQLGITSTLKIWEMDIEKMELKPSLIAAIEYRMEMANKIVCTGHGNYVLICVNSGISGDNSELVMYNLKEDEWTVLPQCLHEDGIPMTFTIACSFMPDFRAKP